MKIGILTYHFSINFGAVLQCYALQEALKSLGQTVYVIDYISKAQQDNIALYRKCSSLRAIVKNTALLPFHFERKKRNQLFNTFKTNSLDCTDYVTDRNDLEKLIKELELDVIFVGSDQVWNPTIKDFDKIFFLDNINIKKIGYSVSLGAAEQCDLSLYKKEILEFDYFTAREKSGADIICKVCGIKPEISVDPTYLVSTDEWQRLSKSFPEYQNTVVCYFLNKEKYKENVEKAKKFALEHNLNFVLIDLRISCTSIKAKGIINVGPIEFLSYIYNSSIVITDSFHGTVFSILLNKPFYSINNKPEGNDTRRLELLSVVDLENQYVSNYMLKENDDIPNINYSYVNKKLENIKVNSLAQLKNICDNVL